MTFHFFREQSNPDGKSGHEEREEMHTRQRKIDGKKAKKKFTGLRKRWQERKMRVTAQADPNTIVRPRSCPCYKPGCTFHNCDDCKTIARYRKALELKKNQEEKNGS